MKAKASIRAMTICIIGLLCSTKMYADSPERADSSSVIRMIDYLQKTMRFNLDRKSTRLNSSHRSLSRMPSSA